MSKKEQYKEAYMHSYFVFNHIMQHLQYNNELYYHTNENAI